MCKDWSKRNMSVSDAECMKCMKPWGPKCVQILQRCTGGFQERPGEICHGNVRQGRRGELTSWGRLPIHERIKECFPPFVSIFWLKIEIWPDVPVGAATRHPEKWPWPSRKHRDDKVKETFENIRNLCLSEWWSQFATQVLMQVFAPPPPPPDVFAPPPGLFREGADISELESIGHPLFRCWKTQTTFCR